jgi:hypothetical protein
MVDVEGSLRRAGFTVKRGKDVGTRYVLVVDGQAPLEWSGRCLAGGYDFDYLTASLVDTASNETVLTWQGKGMSENCPPLSGTLFRDMAGAVAKAWK